MFRIAFLVLSLTLFTVTVAIANPMVHQQGTSLVDGNGKPIKLRGVLLEGWLMWNGPLWGTGLNPETHIRNRLKALVGEAETARFEKAIYDTFITERDIQMIARLELNVVRIPFNHSVLERNGKVDYSAPGWAYIDRLLPSGALANPMVHQQGNIIVDGQGKPLKLRGVLLEGWLMWVMGTLLGRIDLGDRNSKKTAGTGWC